MNTEQLLNSLNISAVNNGTATGLVWLNKDSEKNKSYSPVDGNIIAEYFITSEENYNLVIEKSLEAFNVWKLWPAPKRGEVVRQIGEALRHKREDLGRLVSYEMGKSLQEGIGEVQEMIDICDYSTGLSRQLYGNMVLSNDSKTRR